MNPEILLVSKWAGHEVGTVLRIVSTQATVGGDLVVDAVRAAWLMANGMASSPQPSKPPASRRREKRKTDAGA